MREHNTKKERERELARIRMARWVKNNPEKAKATFKRWYQSHIDEVREKARIKSVHRWQDPMARATQREWIAKNRDRVRTCMRSVQ
jgi:hypothetical protein